MLSRRTAWLALALMLGAVSAHAAGTDAAPDVAWWVWPAALTCAIRYLGLLVERRFFFAQARHPQGLYCQAVA